MDSGKKTAIGVTAVLLVVAAVRFGMIYHERQEANAPVEQQATHTMPDELVFLKQMRPDSLKDMKDLVGKPLWVSAGGQINYYPYAAHSAQYNKIAGTLLGAEKITVKDAFEQVAPKSALLRIPRGDKQVLLAFTKDGDATVYAAPVGYKDQGRYTFYTDEVFFYDDPHTLYSHWGADTWKAVDAHRAALGMSEHQVQMALGQVSKSVSKDVGNRTVIYDNLGKPFEVTFDHDKATKIVAETVRP
jgi:hypothetical protein